MKTARNILWALFPISFILRYVLIQTGVINSLLFSNIAVSIIFIIPITAMLLQTLLNKEKNLSNNHFILKMAFVLGLYLMIIFMFATVLIAN